MIDVLGRSDLLGCGMYVAEEGTPDRIPTPHERPALLALLRGRIQVFRAHPIEDPLDFGLRIIPGALLSHDRLMFPPEVGERIPISVDLDQGGPEKLVNGLYPFLVSRVPSTKLIFKFLNSHVESILPD